MSAPVVAPRFALAVVATIFFLRGSLTCLNGILILRLKAVFELNFARAMLVQFAFLGAHFLMSLPAGRLVTHVDHKKSIVFYGLSGSCPAPAMQAQGA